MKFPSADWFKLVLSDFKGFISLIRVNKFICVASLMFEEEWSKKTFKRKLKAYANEWLKECGRDHIMVGNGTLFIGKHVWLEDNEGRALRIEFLNWLIAKLS